MATQVLSTPGRLFVPGSAPSANTKFPENLETLGTSTLFAGLSKTEVAEIASCARMRVFARDELLYSQGQLVRSLIVLQSGTVKHTQLSSDGDEVLLRMTGTGEAVNLQADPAGCNHTCSARAIEQCRAWIWEHNRLQEMLDRYPQVRRNITKVLTSHLHELEERFREVATEKVARRLALVLVRLLKQVGKDTPEGVQVSLSREELAQMTGTTLFTISRVLSRWAEQGLVTPKREAVIIRNAALLATVSEDFI
jgi:CRP-like cAMP-binding protein